MKHLKPYNELFGFRSKKANIKKDINHLLSFVGNNYKNLEFISADLHREHSSISYVDGSDFVMYMFTSDGGEYRCIVDVIGNKKNETQEISKEQYDKAISLVKEISDYLDKESDNKKSGVSPKGDLNIDVDELELLELEATERITQALGDSLNKEYEFEVKRMARDASSDRKMIRIKEIVPQGCLSDKNIFFKILMAMDGEDYFIQFDEETPTAYVDLENRKIGTKVMKMFPDTQSMTRSQIRDDKRGIFDLSSSKYNTIEFLNQVKELLSQINDSLKS